MRPAPGAWRYVSFCLGEHGCAIAGKPCDATRDPKAHPPALLVPLAGWPAEAARRALPLLMFPLLAAGDLLAIYNELRSIHLRTLNKVWWGQPAQPLPDAGPTHGRLCMRWLGL